MTAACAVASFVGTSADIVSLASIPITLVQWYRGEMAGQKALTIQSYLEYLRRADHLELAIQIETSNEKQVQCLTQITALKKIMEQAFEQLPEKIGDVLLQNLFDLDAYKIDATDSAFEKSYLDHMGERYGKLRTLGVREMKELKQELSVAYVSLNVASKNESEEETAPVDAESNMMANPLMTIQGPAGSGKTTLLHWVATRCADYTAARNPWAGGIPFVIPLRSLPEQAKGRPKGAELLSYSIDPDARHLVAAGDALLPHLKYDKVTPHGWRAVVLSAHAIARVGSHSAVEMLVDPKGYGGDKRQSVIEQVISCPGLNVLRIPRVQASLSAPGDLWWRLQSALETVEDLSPLAKCTDILVLNLENNCKIQSFATLAALKKLQILTLARTRISDDDLAHVAALTALRNLSVQDTQVTDLGLAQIKSLATIQTLNLGGTHVTDQGLTHIEGLTAIEWLSLSQTQVTDLGLAKIKNLSKLQALFLGGTSITDIGLSELKGFTALRSLSLSNTRVTDQGIAHLIELSSLQSLVLRHTRVSDKGLSFITRLTALRRLDLSDTQITDTGLASLKELKSLQTLSLSHTQVTDKGLVAIKEFTTLKELDLSGTQVTEKGVAEIKAALPKLQLLIRHLWQRHFLRQIEY